MHLKSFPDTPGEFLTQGAGVRICAHTLAIEGDSNSAPENSLRPSLPSDFIFPPSFGEENELVENVL